MDPEVALYVKVNKQIMHCNVVVMVTIINMEKSQV